MAVFDTIRGALERRRSRRAPRARFWELAGHHTPVLAVDDRHGNRMLVSTADVAVGRELFLHGEFDGIVLDAALAALAERGFVPSQLVDVGANIGTVTIDLLSRLPQARAVAIEPDTANMRLLRQNLVGNGLDERVTCIQAAVSDADTTLVLELATDNLGDHRVRIGDPAPGRFGETSRETRSVRAVRLDGLVAQGGVTLDVPTLLWLDVQGHEAHALTGAASFARCPTVIELWPYGLRRATGHERLLAALEAYEGEILDLRAGAAPIPRERLAAVFAEVEARAVDPFTDLLLVPVRRGAP
jgi:FkbM family methyltransferase